MSWKLGLARVLAPEEFAQLENKQRDIEMTINKRVAEIILQMDPFGPLLQKYNIIFSEQYERPEDKLDDPSKMRLIMWAYGVKNDPSFLHLVNWIRNTQGNATLRKAKNPDEWFFGRAAIATITLLVDEVGRLASHYEEILANKGRTFDPLSVE